jgi:hypothetical protein
VLAIKFEALFLREHLHPAILAHRLNFLELRDRFLDRLIVRQQTTEPAVVHIELSAALRFFFYRVLCLTLRANE